MYYAQRSPLLFKILTKTNPMLAMLGTSILSICTHTCATHLGLLHLGWLLLLTYNAGNIYVYYIRKRNFWMYSLIAIWHLAFGLFAVIG